MGVFPLFVDLKDKPCVVVGGGGIASRKIDILLRFEAALTVIAPEINGEVQELGNQGRIKIIEKEYSEQYINNAFLVVAATSSAGINEKVYMDARARNIQVNTVDDPDKCTFFFPSVVKRGDLTVGISTSGNYPALSKKVRKITEEIITEEYTEILKLLGDFRGRIKKGSLSQQDREKILKQVVNEFYDQGEISHQALRALIDKYEIH